MTNHAGYLLYDTLKMLPHTLTALTVFILVRLQTTPCATPATVPADLESQPV